MQNTRTQASKKKVLIIEDEGDMGFLLNIILSDKNVELENVKNLAAARDYLQEEKPSLVLLDNKLPDGFGVDFIPVLKKNDPSVKVAMISGFDGAAEDVALDNGADTYIKKPFTREQLSGMVQSLLDMKQ
jgi:two-component system, OmpR family, response regulator